MALDEFWGNLRTAVSFYAPSVSTDSARIDPSEQEHRLREAVMWLTPRSVEGFDPADFGFLDAEQRSALQESVERFRAVAGQVPGNKPGTREQVEEGSAAFQGILRILPLLKFAEAEAFRTQVLLERELRGQLPRWVTGIACETGIDVTGDPAVWIWVDVTDAATDKRKVAKEGQAIRDTIESAYRRIGGRRWPHIRFRSPDAFLRQQGEPA